MIKTKVKKKNRIIYNTVFLIFLCLVVYRVYGVWYEETGGFQGIQDTFYINSGGFLANETNCLWGVKDRYSCNDPICKTYNVQKIEESGHHCEYEGYGGEGLFAYTKYDRTYYVCEGYGRVAVSCDEYYKNWEEMQEDIYKRLKQ